MKRVLVLILILFLLNGCVTFRPHTKTEKILLGAFVTSQMADIASTEYALNHGCKEMNPIYGKDPSLGKMILFKGLFVGIIYLLGQIDPKHRPIFYSIPTAITLGAVANNVYQANKEQEK